MKLRIAICDDNSSVIEIIHSAISSQLIKHNIDSKIDLFLSYEELQNSLIHNYYDLLFLDIKTPTTDGIEFAKGFRENNNDTDIVFISSKEERVFDTFKVQPFAFVRKSNFLIDITDVINRYISSKKEDSLDNTFSFISHGTRVNESLKNILYIEGNGVYQTLYFKEDNKKPLEISSKMKILEKELSKFGFIRIHKGYLVNFIYINSIGNNVLILKNKCQLPIARRKLMEVKKRFLELCDQNGILLF